LLLERLYVFIGNFFNNLNKVRARYSFISYWLKLIND